MQFVLVFSGAALLCTVAELLFEDVLEDSSADFIEMLQEGRSTLMDLFFIAVGGVTAVCFLFISGVIYLVSNREVGVLGTIAGYFGAALSGFLKMVIAHPRPFWKYSKIAGLSCHKDFGAPSGHALSVGAALMTLGALWLESGEQITRKVCALGIVGFITAIDRSYLGAHFYFQVVLGLSYGGLIATVLLEPKVRAFVRKLAFNWRLLVTVNAGIVVFVSCGFLMYLFREPFWDGSWEVNFSNNCKGNLDLDGAFAKNMSEVTLSLFVGGYLLGYYFTEKNLGMPEYSHTLAVGCFFGYLGVFGLGAVLERVVFVLLPGFLKILAMCFSRFAVGLAISYGLPLLISSKLRISYTALELSNLNKSY